MDFTEQIYKGGCPNPEGNTIFMNPHWDKDTEDYKNLQFSMILISMIGFNSKSFSKNLHARRFTEEGNLQFFLIFAICVSSLFGLKKTEPGNYEEQVNR